MNTQNPITESTSNPLHSDKPIMDNIQSSQPRSLVPKGITIGLAAFALIMSLAGYGFRLLAGHEVAEVLLHAAVLVPAFVIGIPLLFWLGARIFNKLNGTHIEGWNAISLGYLTSCISLLWIMGTYS